MSLVLTILLAVQLLSALAMIGLILIQHGKGADMGAAFGSGSANFLSRTTAVLATVFFVCTLALAYFGNARPASSGSVLERAAVTAPAAEGAAGTATQIPGSQAPAAPVPSAPATSGAGQIPSK
jgi:preprotein translocase subunit SecG